MGIAGFLVSVYVKYPTASWRGIKLVAQQSCGVFDPCGSRQTDVQARPLGSLPTGIKAYINRNFYLFIFLYLKV